MARDLSILISSLNPVAWYPYDDFTTDGAFIDDVQDESGNNRDLIPTNIGTDRPVWEADSLNALPSIKFDEESPIYHNGALVARDVYCICKYDDGADFGANERGLLSDAATNPILVGQQSTTKFLDLGLAGSTAYRKSKQGYALNDQQAPFDNFELVQIANTAGWSLDGILAGQDRSDITRRWIGRLIEPIFFSDFPTDLKKQRVELYYDLKYKLWQLNNTTIDFPSQEITGILYARYYQFPKAWAEATDSHEYEDLGRSFNLAADDVPQRWEIGFTGLYPNEAAVFEEFYDQVKHHQTFNFLDKEGVTHTGVRIEMGEFRREHQGHRSDIISVSFRLVKFP